MKVVIMLYTYMPPNYAMKEWISLWQYELAKIPEVVEYEIVEDYGDFSREKLDRILSNADAVIGLSIYDGLLNEDFYRKNPSLKYIATLSHGYGSFDPSLASKYGVKVVNTIYGSNTIAQYAFALLLDICNGVTTNSSYLKNEYWLKSDHHLKEGYVYSCVPQIELKGKTLGIIGLGNIGLQVAAIAHGFEMEVIGYSKYQYNSENHEYIKDVSLSELLSKADIISLHCPLTSETREMINEKTISMMKPGVILINTARGGLINEQDLLVALNNRHVYAAGLDVLQNEPSNKPDGLLLNPYCKVTGHIAWMTKESCLRMTQNALEKFREYIASKRKGSEAYE